MTHGHDGLTIERVSRAERVIGDFMF